MSKRKRQRAAGSSAPACSAFRWRFRAACISSHVARRYSVQWVNETHGGHAAHYGWPHRSVGVEWSWSHNTWFAGWELWPNDTLQGSPEAQRKEIP